MYNFNNQLKISITTIFITFFSCGDNVSIPKENTQASSVQFFSNVKVPVVEGTLNGKKAFFIIDSGASVSVLDEKQSNRYGYHIDEGFFENSTIAGYGGTSSVSAAAVGVDLVIGNKELSTDYRSKDISEVVNVIKQNTGVTITGIIGSDIMKSYKFVLDYSSNSVYIKK